MKLALDIDGTITKHPAVFLFLAQGWLKNGGELHIITARDYRDRRVTLELLHNLGFTYETFTLHMYPVPYDWPFASESHEHFIKRAHSKWKAELCKSLGIDILYDDCPYNVKACVDAEVPVFRVH